MDVDGDQLNAVVNNIIIKVAERENKENNIVPLLYDLGKAPDKPVDRLEMFNGLKRAHDYSGIGAVSNNLTKLWNKDNPDRYIAGCLTYYNNQVIDAAKTGEINEFENYPALNKRLQKAVGGKRANMPYFFQFSKNGRRFQYSDKPKKYAKPNNSTMNRICARFDDIGNININKANVPPFNWQMLLDEDNHVYSIPAITIFCNMDDGNKTNLISSKTELDQEDVVDARGYEFIKEAIIEELNDKVGTLEFCYPSIVKYLFAGSGMNKPTHKQMFWRVFGEIACRNIAKNLQTYTVCEKCGMKIPAWVERHSCPKNTMGFFECVDCGAWCKRINSKQCRCEECQKEHKHLSNKLIKRSKYVHKKVHKKKMA